MVGSYSDVAVMGWSLTWTRCSSRAMPNAALLVHGRTNRQIGSTL